MLDNVEFLHQAVEVQTGSAGKTVVLKVPMKHWSKPLRAEWESLVASAVSEKPEKFERKVQVPAMVSECRCTANCSQRRIPKDMPGCAVYCRSLCGEMSRTLTGGPLTFEDVGLLLGVSKQRAKDIFDEGNASLRRYILADPAVVELARELMIGGTASAQ